MRTTYLVISNAKDSLLSFPGRQLFQDHLLCVLVALICSRSSWGNGRSNLRIGGPEPPQRLPFQDPRTGYAKAQLRT